jgi:hypothetical protein
MLPLKHLLPRRLRRLLQRVLAPLFRSVLPRRLQRRIPRLANAESSSTLPASTQTVPGVTRIAITHWEVSCTPCAVMPQTRALVMLTCIAIALLKAPPQWDLRLRHLQPQSRRSHRLGWIAVDGATRSTLRAMSGALTAAFCQMEPSAMSAATNVMRLSAIQRRIAIALDERHFNCSSKQPQLSSSLEH